MTEQIFENKPPQGKVERLRVSFVEILAVIALMVAVGGLIVQFVFSSLTGEINQLALFSILAYALVSTLALVLLRQGRVEFANGLIITAFTLAFLVSDEPGVLLILGLLSLIGAALLRQRWAYFLVNLLVFGKFFLLFIQTSEAAQFQFNPQSAQISIEISTLIVVSVVARFLVHAAEQASREAQRSTRLLRSIAAMSTTETPSQEAIFRRIIDVAQESLPDYLVRIFMLDEQREHAELVASSDDYHPSNMQRLVVGAQNVVGRVAQIGNPIIAYDAIDTLHVVPRPIRAEAALPIIYGGNIAGVIDIASTTQRDFDAADLQLFQILADQLSVTLYTWHLNQSVTDRLNENKRLLLEMSLKDQEVRRLNRRLTARDWHEYLEESRPQARSLALLPDGTRTEADWTPQMREVIRSNRPQTEVKSDGRQIIAVPVVLGGEVIGALEIEATTNIIEEATVDLVQGVAQRLALTLNNVRLLEEIRDSAERERRINTIASRYETANSVEELLEITLEELSESLESPSGMIRLGTLPETHPNGHNGHHGGGAT